MPTYTVIVEVCVYEPNEESAKDFVRDRLISGGRLAWDVKNARIKKPKSTQNNILKFKKGMNND